MRDQSPRDNRRDSPRPLDNASRSPSRLASWQVNLGTAEISSRPRQISVESRFVDEREWISPCPATLDLSPEPDFVVNVVPDISPIGAYALGNVETEAEARSKVETEPKQDYLRPRSERIKKRAMLKSSGPEYSTEEPSKKRYKDAPVDLRALQHSLFEPLGKTYPFLPTPVAKPPKLPQAAQDWLNHVIQQDPQTGRIRYVHSPLLRPFNESHLVVLRAAFEAYKDRMDILKESNYEFISVLAECSAAQVRAWFSDQAKEREKKRQQERRKIARLQKQQKQMRKQTWKRQLERRERDMRRLGQPQNYDDPPSDREQIRLNRHKRRLENRSRNNEPPARSYHPLPIDAPALESAKVVSRVRISEDRRVLQRFRCGTVVGIMRGVPLAWTQCRACVSRQAGDNCKFTNFRVFEVASPADKKDVSKYLADHDFYSDPKPDEPSEFILTGLTRSDAEYILAYVGHVGRRLLNKELDMTLGCGSENNKALQRINKEYFRRPSPMRRCCYRCKEWLVSCCYFCTSCGLELCTDCLMHRLESVNCNRAEKHILQQFALCGRYHASTLRNMLDTVDSAVRALPNSSQQLVSNSTANKAAKPKSGGNKSSGSKGAAPTTPLRVPKDISQTDFQRHWAKGMVLVFTGLQLNRHSALLKDTLQKNFGTTKVKVSDATTDKDSVEPMGKFFEQGFSGSQSNSIRFIEAWPEKPLQEVAPRLYSDLLQVLPVPMYTKPNGAFNLLKYLPSEWPNSGPKLHIGEGSTDKDIASIRLACEKSDVLYACVYAERRNGASIKGDSTAVVWDIFPTEDRKKVEDFLAEYKDKPVITKKYTGLLQSTIPYLNEEALKKLQKATGVTPVRVEQKLGEGVMVPAGCIRQAQYLQNTIMAKADFMSPERLWAALDWCREQKEYLIKMALIKTKKVDPLPAQEIAFYSALAMAHVE